jgi:hypothetical protein
MACLTNPAALDSAAAYCLKTALNRLIVIDLKLEQVSQAGQD